MTNLKNIRLNRCKNLKDMPLDLKTLSSFEYLDLQHCSKMKFDNDIFDALLSLQELYLDGCLDLKEVYKGFSNALKAIYATFEGITNLKNVWLDKYKNLEYMSLDLKTLSSLEYLSLQHCTRMKFDDDVFDILLSLQELYLDGYMDLKEVYKEFRNFTSIQYLRFINYKNLKAIHSSFEGMTNLKKIWFNRCENLKDILLDLKSLLLLDYLDLQHCAKMKFDDDAFDVLLSLQILYLEDFLDLKEVHKEFSNIISIQNLSFRNYKNLKAIYAKLGSMPLGLKTLSSLEYLNFQYCAKKKFVDDAFDTLLFLHELHLNGFLDLKELNGYKNEEDMPLDLKILSSLEYLDLQHC
uniref:Uncharacterized protein n=1 Tax=Physcomitrium patens TaxID=3218 RepID=A0A2K1IW95_PHYPA|nr:hypothetical protein PHYPA_025491 [Physcomitrium patens]